MELCATNFLLALGILVLIYLTTLLIAWKIHAFAGKNLFYRTLLSTLIFYGILYTGTIISCFVLYFFYNDLHPFLFASAVAGFYVLGLSSLLIGILSLYGQLLFALPE